MPRVSDSSWLLVPSTSPSVIAAILIIGRDHGGLCLRVQRGNDFFALPAAELEVAVKRAPAARGHVRFGHALIDEGDGK